MTCYEIIVSAVDYDGCMLLIPEQFNRYRATTNTIDMVRKTVLSNCGVIALEADQHNIGRLTAKIFEVTDKGERVYIGSMYDKDWKKPVKHPHRPPAVTIPGF